MRMVIVLAGEHPESLAVGAALKDWSALGLLQPFIWAHAPAGASAADIAGELVTEGRCERVQVLAYLAGTAQVEGVQLCSLTLLGSAQSGPDAEACLRLRRRLSNLETAGKASFVHLIVPTADARPATDALVWPQWHNLLASPEDARTPATLSEQLVSTSDDTVLEAHACSAVASITGSWLGLSSSLFDASVEEVQPGLRLVRAFYRRLDARHVTQALQQNVLGLSGGLPRPREGQLQLEHFDNPDNAASAVWASTLAKHGSLFARERETLPRVPRVQLTLRRALAMFFSFLGAAIRDAPRQWITSIVGGVASGIASRANRVLFGDDSGFEVVVMGRSGRMVDADELIAAVEALTLRAQSAFPEAEMRAGDHSGFWSDAIRAGIGLADGAPPPPGLEPARAGSRQGVMPTADNIVVSPTADLPITGSIAASAGQATLSAIDRLETQRVLRRLQTEEGRATSQEQERSRQQINDWLRRVDATYFGKIALHLAQFQGSVQEEVGQLWQRLQTASSSTEAPPSLVQAQLKLARRIRWRFIAIVVALIVVGAVTGIGIISALLGIAIGAAALVVWFVSSMLTFIRGQRELFQLLHKQRAEIASIPALTENLQRAIRDLNTAIVLYAQYRQWALVLSHFLHEPFGRNNASLVDETPCVMQTNRALAVATARPSPNSIRIAGQRVGQELYSIGWMQELWTALLADAYSAVDPVSVPAPDRVFPDLLHDRAVGTDSRLTAISRQLQTYGVSPVGGERHWSRALRHVQEQQQLLDGLLDDIRSWDGAALGQGAVFLAELANRLPDAPSFDDVSVEPQDRATPQWRQGWCAIVVGAGSVPRVDSRGIGAPEPGPLPGNGLASTGLDSYVLSLLVGGSVPQRQIVFAPREANTSSTLLPDDDKTPWF
jgi:hypothetical protein